MQDDERPPVIWVTSTRRSMQGERVMLSRPGDSDDPHRPPSSIPAPPGVACVRGTAVFGLKAAAHELWGDQGLRDIADRLDAEIRHALLDEIVLPQVWLPEQQLIAICRAAWEGPCGELDGPYSTLLGRAAFHGWGRFQKLILGLVSPDAIAVRVPSLWRRDHTHGTLETELTRGGALVRLRDHPYTETDFARKLFAETLRHVVAMTRVRGRKGAVHERHELGEGGALLIHLTW